MTSHERSQISMPDIHMATAKGGFTIPRNDIHMATYQPTVAPPRKPILKLWERELVDAPEVRRKATVAQLCMSFVLSEIDHFADLAVGPSRLLGLLLSIIRIHCI